MYCSESKLKVSVIMGAYNVAKLGDIFQKAINSVLNQSIGDLELIICDDGSTDKTWDILADIAASDNRVRLIRNHRNEGLAASLNKCLLETNGKYVARQDADDVSAPERFALQIKFLEKHPDISFVGSNVDLWDENGKWGERIFPEYPQPKDFLFTQPFVHGAIMFRKSALEMVDGYRVAKETRRAEDYDMLMRMYAHGLRGSNLQRKLYEFLEDVNAQKRRKYRYRIDEAVVRWKGFSSLGLMPKAIPYIVKPLIVGMVPQRILQVLKKHRNY